MQYNFFCNFWRTISFCTAYYVSKAPVSTINEWISKNILDFHAILNLHEMFLQKYVSEWIDLIFLDFSKTFSQGFCWKKV